MDVTTVFQYVHGISFLLKQGKKLIGKDLKELSFYLNLNENEFYNLFKILQSKELAGLGFYEMS